MRPFVLYHPKTRTTGRAVANLLGIPSGTKCGRKYENISHVIRWGSIRDISATYREGQRFFGRYEINLKKSVQLAGSKLRAIEALSASGIDVPVYTRDIGIVQEDIRTHDSLWFGRSFRHMGATDIVIIGPTTLGVPRPSDYFVRYVHPIKEYRVHVVFQRPVLFQKKYFGEELFAGIVERSVRPNDEEAFREECNLVCNNAHGWRFYDIKDPDNVPEVVVNAGVKAIAALGLDFGAVDIIYTKGEDGQKKAIVLEVNTAPGLRDRNLEIYASAFSLYLGALAQKGA